MLEEIIYQAGRGILTIFTDLMLDMDIAYHAPLPAGPKIIAVNHPTTTDPFYLLRVMQEQVSLLVTEMAFKMPVVGPIIGASGHVRVVHSHGRPAFEEAIRKLRSGRSVGIFPEGSLSPAEGGLCPPRSGAARLALLTGAPVVPVGVQVIREHIHTVETTVKDMSATARWYLNGPYAVTVGSPVSFSGDAEDRDLVGAVSQEIMRRIGQMTRESGLRLQARGHWLAPNLVDTGAYALPNV